MFCWLIEKILVEYISNCAINKLEIKNMALEKYKHYISNCIPC